MDVSEQLRCLFSAVIKKRDESYVVEVPQQELQLGDVQENGTYRVAILSAARNGETDERNTDSGPDRDQETPPVETGEQRDVEIAGLGEQGDGITRVERGFVVIVPDTDAGERVTIEITEVRDNVAFAEVVKRLS